MLVCGLAFGGARHPWRALCAPVHRRPVRLTLTETAIDIGDGAHRVVPQCLLGGSLRLASTRVNVTKRWGKRSRRFFSERRSPLPLDFAED